MNEIITIHEDNNDFPVNGRELCASLGVESNYTTWFNRNCEGLFVENIDFCTLSTFGKRADGTQMPVATIDHRMTIGMAKEICMLQRSEQGREVRRYLISVENAWNTPALIMARALKLADRQLADANANVERLQAKIEADAPRVRFAQNVEGSDNSVLVGTLAKCIKQNGVDIGEKRLFQKLRDDGYLCSEGERRNVPSQRAMDMKLFEVIERTFSAPDGTTFTKLTTKVTGKGQVYFMNRYGDNAHKRELAN